MSAAVKPPHKISMSSRRTSLHSASPQTVQLPPLSAGSTDSVEKLLETQLTDLLRPDGWQMANGDLSVASKVSPTKLRNAIRRQTQQQNAAKLQQIEAELKTKTEALVKATDYAQGLQRNVSVMAKVAQASLEEKKSVEARAKDLQEIIQRQTAEIDKLAGWKDSYQGLQAQVKHLEALNEESEKQLHAAHGKIDALSRQSVTSQEQASDLEQGIKRAQRMLAIKERELEDMHARARTDTTKSDLKALQQDFERLLLNRDQLQATVDHTNDQFEEEKLQHQKTKNVLSLCEIDRDNLHDEVTRLNAALHQGKVTLRELETVIQARDRSLESLRLEFGAAQTEIRILKSSLSHHTTSEEQHIRKVIGLQEDLSAAKAETSSLKTKLHETEKQLSALNAEKQEKLKDIALFQKQLDSMRSDQMDSKQRAEEEHSLWASIKEENTVLREKLAAAQKEISENAKLAEAETLLKQKEKDLLLLNRELTQEQKRSRELSIIVSKTQMSEEQRERIKKQERELQSTIAKLIAAEESSEGAFTCICCMSIYDNPVTCTPCGHSFCRKLKGLRKQAATGSTSAKRALETYYAEQEKRDANKGQSRQASDRSIQSNHSHVSNRSHSAEVRPKDVHIRVEKPEYQSRHQASQPQNSWNAPLTPSQSRSAHGGGGGSVGNSYALQLDSSERERAHSGGGKSVEVSPDEKPKPQKKSSQTNVHASISQEEQMLRSITSKRMDHCTVGSLGPNQDDYFENDHEKEALEQPRPAPNNSVTHIEWQKGNHLGSGAYGEVWLGLDINKGNFIAVKQVHINSQEGRWESRVQSLEKEIAILSNLHHENIVKYLGMERNGSEVNVFLEFVPGGSIASVLEKFGKLNETLIRNYTKQILNGLAYLHGHQIVHRDIKGGNILVDINGTCKLADFGACATLEALSGEEPSLQGTPYWMAPEVIKQTGHGRKVDIWSVGCTVIEMATGRPPWHQFKTHIAALYHIGQTSDPPELPTTLSPECSDFIYKCLTRDPKERPTAFQLLEHPFITGGRLQDTMEATDTATSAHSPLFDTVQAVEVHDKEQLNQDVAARAGSGANSSSNAGAAPSRRRSRLGATTGEKKVAQEDKAPKKLGDVPKAGSTHDLDYYEISLVHKESTPAEIYGQVNVDAGASDSLIRDFLADKHFNMMNKMQALKDTVKHRKRQSGGSPEDFSV